MADKKHPAQDAAGGGNNRSSGSGGGQGAAGGPTTGERSEDDIVGNKRVRGADPSPDNRNRGETAAG